MRRAFPAQTLALGLLPTPPAMGLLVSWIEASFGKSDVSVWFQMTVTQWFDFPRLSNYRIIGCSQGWV